jgi:hypothetical protein
MPTTCRHLEKKAAEEKEKERQERRRKERKNRDAFMELLQRHVSEGVLVARMRWKVTVRHAQPPTVLPAAHPFCRLCCALPGVCESLLQ